MAKYIDIEKVYEVIDNAESAGSVYEGAIIREEIQNLPPADVRPVVRGRWLTTDAFPHRIYCSICYKTYIPNDRWQIWVDGDLPRDFCPNCGADMRGGDNDGRIHY